MNFNNKDLTTIMQEIDFGSSIAELDNLLESSRVDTSVFGDLYSDRIDLIPGTKGSGKSALYRIFVEFLPSILLESRKVVIAHGVTRQGDNVFHAFKNEFEQLSEDDFINFWCIYLVSLAYEQFIKNPIYNIYLKNHTTEIAQFKEACANSYIPEIKKEKSLHEVLEWTLNALKKISPKLKYKPPEGTGEFELTLIEEQPSKSNTNVAKKLPYYTGKTKVVLKNCLLK